MRRMNALLMQMFRFGIVGCICTLFDYFMMIGLTELVGLHYLLSSTISFSVSTVLNYILSTRFVFEGKQDTGPVQEFTAFFLLSMGGLGLNTLLMWLFTEKAGIYYMLSKIVVTSVVMIYNFVTRKMLLEERAG